LAAGRGADLALLEAAADLLQSRMPGRGYGDLPAGLSAMAAGDPRFGAKLSALLLSRAAARQATRAVPDTVVPEVARQAWRILTLETPSLDDDVFRKDISICLLLAFPCVAQVIEESGGVPRSAVLSGSAAQAVRLLGNFAVSGWRRRPYLEMHTHTPMLDGFNPAGWDRCCRMAADLLRRRTDCLGLLSGSWYFDPAVAVISPRLAYVAGVPLAGGAFRARLGASAEDTELATAASVTRRQLVADGHYTPTRWLLVWPRASLLAWADASSAELVAQEVQVRLRG
jgi:hypothetical protein